MSYYEYPHTRTYDADLGALIRELNELKELVAPLESSIKEINEKIKLIDDVVTFEKKVEMKEELKTDTIKTNSISAITGDLLVDGFHEQTISLIGDVTGTAKWDGTKSLTISTNIQGVTPTDITTINNDLTINGDLTMGLNKSIYLDGDESCVCGHLVSCESLISNRADLNDIYGTLHGTADNAVNATTATNATNAVSAEVADMLATTDVGNTNKPVYFENGLPVVCGDDVRRIIIGNTIPTSDIGDNGDIYIMYE